MELSEAPTPAGLPLLIAQQLVPIPVHVLARRVKDALNVPVQRPHDTDPRVHQRIPTFRMPAV
jgi:hypothetical protein